MGTLNAIVFAVVMVILLSLLVLHPFLLSSFSLILLSQSLPFHPPFSLLCHEKQQERKKRTSIQQAPPMC